MIVIASFMDWSMRDPRALAIVIGLWALILGPTLVRSWRFEREYREHRRRQKQRAIDQVDSSE